MCSPHPVFREHLRLPPARPPVTWPRTLPTEPIQLHTTSLADTQSGRFPDKPVWTKCVTHRNEMVENILLYKNEVDLHHNIMMSVYSSLCHVDLLENPWSLAGWPATVLCFLRSWDGLLVWLWTSEKPANVPTHSLIWIFQQEDHKIQISAMTGQSWQHLRRIKYEPHTENNQKPFLVNK